MGSEEKYLNADINNKFEDFQTCRYHFLKGTTNNFFDTDHKAPQISYIGIKITEREREAIEWPLTIKGQSIYMLAFLSLSKPKHRSKIF